MRKLSYREGDVFEVPLGGGRRALGVVARAKKGPGFLGYFFFTEPGAPLGALDPKDAFLIARSSDMALIGDALQRRGKGEVRWPIVGHLEHFTREQWSVPLFYRHVDGGPPPALVQYDNEAEASVTLYAASPGDATRYPSDGAWGARAVERYLVHHANVAAPAAVA